MWRLKMETFDYSDRLKKNIVLDLMKTIQQIMNIFP